MKRSLLLGFAWLASCVYACGGRTDLDESLDGGNILGPDGGIIGKDGSTLPDGTTIGPDGGINPPDSGINPFDASLPPSDGGITLDAGNPGTPIACGMTTCDSNTQVCCVSLNGQMVSEACTGIGQCQGVATLNCTSAANCTNNDVCCASLMGMTAESQCEPKCAGGFQNPQLCAQDSECPMGQHCQPTGFGYKICRM